LCCIKYEYQQYAKALLKCPNIGQTIMYGDLRGRVVGVNPLNEYIYADVEGKGRIRLSLGEITFDEKEAMKEPKKNHRGKKKKSEEQVVKKLESK